MSLEKQLAALVPQIAEATKRETDASKRIAAFAKAIPIRDFIKLDDAPDAEAQINLLRSRVEAAKNVAPLSQRPMPESLPQIELDLAVFFSILQTTFSGMRADAREAVQAHFKRHEMTSGIEAWVTQGRTYVEGSDCPFCGQDLASADLMEAYDSYFNAEYNDLMAKVGVLSKGVETRLSDSKLDNLEPRVAANEARIKAWADQLDLNVPQFDLQLARSSVSALRAAMGELAAQKQLSPLASVGTATDVASATTLLAQIQQQVTAYNEAVAATALRIRQFLAQLNSESPAALAASVARLESVVARRSQGARQAVEDFVAAEAVKKELNGRKTATRKALDDLLPKTMSTYQGRINTLLRRFGAGFEIVRLTSDYTGGVLRSDYALQIRGRSVELGKKGAAGPGFGRMLSEGDKRTLALAFFLAKIQGLPGNLRGNTVVFDDPMCSFDQRRRENTITSIMEVASRGGQVIVLCHDPYFLRDLRDRIEGPGLGVKTVVHEIKRVQDDYSQFAPCDLDRICESDHHRSHRIVKDYMEGCSTEDRRAVARELRPLIEGFMKQRFPPPILPARANLGAILKLISAAAHSPLAHARPYLSKLNALNQFDTKYHHNDGNDLGMPDDVELQQFARMTLEVIYGDYRAP
ncbi:AAA family ATPase [Pseudoxanthomonas sp. UTMC 1351]|uniref:AAA family ATPase n=1 Tax=Pseudoxanthomonas sp. UTMC 1351 TaxID=2695853 RepID=UPI0034CE6A09